MTTTRVVTGPVGDGHGAPRDAYNLRFYLPATYTADMTLPPDTVLAVTDETGDLLTGVEGEPLVLVCGVKYEAQYASAEIVNGTTVSVPRGSRYPIVVPEGEGPISLATLQATSNPVTSSATNLQAMIAYFVENPPLAVYAPDLED